MCPAVAHRALLTAKILLPILPGCLVYLQPQVLIERRQMPVALPFVEGAEAPGENGHQDKEEGKHGMSKSSSVVLPRRRNAGCANKRHFLVPFPRSGSQFCDERPIVTYPHPPRIVANAEHLHILESGVAVWNIWRSENPAAEPDLSGVDLTGRWLQTIDLSRTNLRGAMLTVAELERANLDEADLRDGNLTGADLSHVSARGCWLNGVDMSFATLTFADFTEARMEDCRLSEAILFNTVLRKAQLQGAHLRETILTGADLTGANLSGAHLQDVITEGAILPIGLPPVERRKTR